MTSDYEAFTRMIVDDMRAHGGQVTIGPMAGRPLMLLTTKGAKSGQERTSIVTYTRDGDRYVIAASKSGAPTNPAWFYNLKAHANVTVEVGGETFAARANISSGDDRDRLWDQHSTQRAEFREYPKITDRVIPMILLERID
jgi:deazaflavin-dependent oxidoreductase (nitroreductase family)